MEIVEIVVLAALVAVVWTALALWAATQMSGRHAEEEIPQVQEKERKLDT
jgi:hypothetical protein